jgi:hypothetical protein
LIEEIDGWRNSSESAGNRDERWGGRMADAPHGRTPSRGREYHR